MPVFDILCLANSVKLGGSCIAGLRLDGGGWVRPVAGTEHGQIYPIHCTLQDGSLPQLFDQIRISFVDRKATAHQPENWLIANQPWQLISRGLSPETARLLESNLDNGPALLGNFSHLISIDRFEKDPVSSSLCLIHPRNLRWRIKDCPGNSHKPFAQFRLDGSAYLLPVTDPIWIPAFREVPVGVHPVTACGIAENAKVLLTVSLGEPFDDGYCYKLVAGILQLEPDPIAEPPEFSDPSETFDPVGQPMNPRHAARIIRDLARGTDPYTGQPLTGDGPLSSPDVIRAFHAAAEALQNIPPREKLPELAQAGKKWDAAEDEILARRFDAGEAIAAIARAHGRTRGSINSRLIRLGKIAGSS
jgi:hypothetical protein